MNEIDRVDDEIFGKLQAENARLREENEGLRAGMGEIETKYGELISIAASIYENARTDSFDPKPWELLEKILEKEALNA